jgi:transcriptional regulator with XRE-family HTH domain
MTLMEWRKAMGLSQYEVADLLGVKQGVVSRWERGDRAPALDSALKILKVTKGKVTLEALVRASDRG